MWLLLMLCCIVLFLVAKYDQIHQMLTNLQRDFRELMVYVSLTYYGLFKYTKSACDHFDKIVSEHPQKVLIYFEDEVWTSSKIKEEANRIALYFQNQGYSKGDIVALILDNCAEYACIWLGLAQIGVVTALINTNLVKGPLKHSFTVSKCKAIICGSNHAASVADVINNFEDIRIYQFSSKENDDIFPNYINMKKGLSEIDPTLFERTLKLNGRDNLLYIFTSGTTGLPKAAILTHTRFNMLSSGAAILPKNSVIYCPLPLYHASGGVIVLAQAFVWGSTVAIRKKFSASNFWKDCAKYRCNVSQYIGEMCRYLVSAQTDAIVKHPVKIMFGNGLKPQIWKELVNRFNIEQIYEAYGSTEGCAFIVNLDNRFGSVGRTPRILKPIHPILTVKFNEETGEPLRNNEGRCIINTSNEPGLLIAKIMNLFSLTQFKGYTDKEETNKKILKDVFKPGDRYFNTGDTFETDTDGFLYFLDRTGDTFRWKGENVSTNEVEGIISNLVQLKDATVFGVQVEGTEGKAGMAVIASNNQEIDTDYLLNGFKENLPPYAIPLFVRVTDSLPMTSTFKLQKTQLRQEGYNVNIVKDNIYFHDQPSGKYVLLTQELYEKIIHKELKF